MVNFFLFQLVDLQLVGIDLMESTNFKAKVLLAAAGGGEGGEAEREVSFQIQSTKPVASDFGFPQLPLACSFNLFKLHS